MKKIILFFVCVIALLLCAFPFSASAAGNMEGIDYSRIKGSGSRVTLNLGELVFEGELSRGTMLSKEEQDEIIKKVMNDMNITSGMLTNASSLISAAHSLEGFGMKDAVNALLKLTGADTVVGAFQYLTGGNNKTSAQISADIAKDATLTISETVLEDILTQGGTVALEGAGKTAFKLLFLLPSLTDIGIESLEKYEKNKETLTVALNRQAMVDGFYDECNRRIEEASGDRGKWEIRFDGQKNTRVYDFDMWGIGGLMATWKLSGVLEQVTEIDGSAGMYRGTLWLDIEGMNMAQDFDAKIMTGQPLVRTAVDSWSMIVDGTNDTYSTTVLKRRVQGDISFIVSAGGSGTYTSTVSGSLTSGGDVIEFSFNHAIEGTGDMSLAKIYRGAFLTSNDIHTISALSKGYTSSVAGTQPHENDGRTDIAEMDIGTVWKPLESTPTITIYK